jgi:hypothetical protein
MPLTSESPKIEHVVAFVTEMVNKKVKAEGKARVKVLKRNAQVA